jgi:hypothetical protein
MSKETFALSKTMRAFLVACAAAVGLIQCDSAANADTYLTWTLSTDIPLSDGGTLNGYFTIDATSGFINGSPFNLVTAGGSTNFNQDYTAAINASDPNSVTVDFFAPNPPYSSSLTLVFEDSLLVANSDNPIEGGIDGPSYECEGYSCSIEDVRYVDGGYASTTPLPAALPLFATGLGAAGLFGWRRKRKAAATAA